MDLHTRVRIDDSMDSYLIQWIRIFSHKSRVDFSMDIKKIDGSAYQGSTHPASMTQLCASLTIQVE